MSDWGAVVLTGGTAARLGGADKASVELDGATLLEHALAAVSAAGEVIVVGEPVPTSRPVTNTREDPPSGGPAAGLLAGLAAFPRPPRTVVVLAVDMPRVTAGTVARLREALAGGGSPYDGAVLVDAGGRQQPLCAAYRTGALRAAAPADPHGLSLRDLLSGLRLLEVPARGDEAADVDTWDDLRRLRDPGC